MLEVPQPPSLTNPNIQYPIRSKPQLAASLSQNTLSDPNSQSNETLCVALLSEDNPADPRGSEA